MLARWYIVGGYMDISEVVVFYDCGSTPPSTSTLDGDGWSTPRIGLFIPGKDPVPIVQGAGWTPGPVWTGAENLASTGIRSPDRPARSEAIPIALSKPLVT